MYSRIDRINELIKETLGGILNEEVDISSGVLLTLTKVKTSRDLRHVSVYVSIFPEKKFGEIMRELQKKIFVIQGSLNKKLSMKPLPRIEFVPDKTEAEADKIEKLLKEIH